MLNWIRLDFEGNGRKHSYSESLQFDPLEVSERALPVRFLTVPRDGFFSPPGHTECPGKIRKAGEWNAGACSRTFIPSIYLSHCFVLTTVTKHQLSAGTVPRASFTGIFPGL